MKLRDARYETPRGAVRLSASVEWEDSPLPTRTIWAEFAPELAPALSGELDGFAVAAAVVAQHHGERRLVVEGTLCPRLAQGLSAATRLLAKWFGGSEGIAIEASRGFAPRLPADRPRSAIFFSGGIDSLFTVARNRDRYRPDHPAFFRDAIVVDGYGLHPAGGSPRARDHWGRTQRATSAAARFGGLDPLFVRVNFRDLDEDFGFFGTKYHAGMLAAVAHLLSRRVTSATISAGLDVTMLRPWGSHPMLDVLYSGSGLSILHDGVETSRQEKVDRLAAWPEVLSSVMVCHEGPLASSTLNCGRCEKCVRTRAALLVAGAAEDFDAPSPSPAELRALPLGPHPWAVAGYWAELADRFHARRRPEMRAVAQEIAARARAISAWHTDRGWKGALRRIDRRFFASFLLRTSRELRGRA
jgi:hypothetical protein